MSKETHKERKGKTRFGVFLERAKAIVPDAVEIAGELITGDVGGAIDVVGSALKKKADKDQEAFEMLNELEAKKIDFVLDSQRLAVQDKESARNREVELAKVGGVDWMMYATGLVGLASFLALLWAVLFKTEVTETKTFHHLLGMVEGVVLVSMFGYYYAGTKNN